MRRKLLHKMKEVCGASYQYYDEGRTNSGRTSSDRNPAFNIYLYVFVHRCISFLLASQVICYCILSHVINAHTLLLESVFSTFKFSFMTFSLFFSPSCALDIVL